MQRNWMMFVDGENFTIRGQEVASRDGVKLKAGEYWQKDVFLWLPGIEPRRGYFGGSALWQGVNDYAVRAHYYTSVSGDDQLVASTREALKTLGFHPEVFKKPSGQKSKGVDIALTTNMLAHAFRNNYDVAWLVAGDGDYAPLVEEVKREGKIVNLAFFSHGLSPALRLSADTLYDLTGYFQERWSHLQLEAERAAKA